MFVKTVENYSNKCFWIQISVRWWIGRGTEKGDSRKQEIGGNAVGGLWKLQLFEKPFDGIYE